MSGFVCNKTVSVVTPLYKGQKYVKGILDQINDAVNYAKCFCEIVFVNDCPEEDINLPDCEYDLDIHVIDDKKHRGIHGSRAYGLIHSHNEYVLFLDQDDVIRKEFFSSQFKSIGSNDIAVCQCIHENSMFYNEYLIFDKVINYQTMLTRGNTIVSPGQCLIRRTAIPEDWVKNIMQINCADDYFLWILLFSKTNKIALNNDVLFEHIVKGDNLSIDFVNLQKSENEMLELISNNMLIQKEDVETLKNCLERNHVSRIGYLQRYRRLFFALDEIIKADKANSISEKLYKNGIRDVAIYGAGEIGRIIKLLIQDRIITKYYIDRDYKNKKEDIPVVPLDKELKQVDAIIVSLTTGAETVCDQIKQSTDMPIYSLEDLVNM